VLSRRLFQDFERSSYGSVLNFKVKNGRLIRPLEYTIGDTDHISSDLLCVGRNSIEFDRMVSFV